MRNLSNTIIAALFIGIGATILTDDLVKSIGISAIAWGVVAATRIRE